MNLVFFVESANWFTQTTNIESGVNFVEFAFHVFDPIAGVLNANFFAATNQFPLAIAGFSYFVTANVIVNLLNKVRNNVECNANQCIETKSHPAANSCVTANNNFASITK